MRSKRQVQNRGFSIAQALRSCLSWLEVRCSIECCGIHALKPSRVLIGIWMDSAGTEKSMAALGQARKVALVLAEAQEPLSCAWLNYREQHGSERRELQQLLREIIDAMEECIGKKWGGAVGMRRWAMPPCGREGTQLRNGQSKINASRDSGISSGT